MYLFLREALVAKTSEECWRMVLMHWSSKDGRLSGLMGLGRSGSRGERYSSVNWKV